MKNYILIPYDYDEALFNSFGFDEFILPLANYSIGFEYYFSIFEINELAKKYKINVLINKFLHKKDIEDIKNIINNLNNVNLFFIEDLGLTGIIPKNKIVIFQNHIINNYESINYLNENGFDKVVVSNELTNEELKVISSKTKSQLYYFIFNRNMLMYSKRKLVSNYLDYYSYDLKTKTLLVKEKVSQYDLFIKEENDGTTIFDGKIYSLLNERNKLPLKNIIINLNNINSEEKKEVLNNYRDKVNIETNNYFYLNKINYKVKK